MVRKHGSAQVKGSLGSSVERGSSRGKPEGSVHSAKSKCTDIALQAMRHDPYFLHDLHSSATPAELLKHIDGEQYLCPKCAGEHNRASHNSVDARAPLPHE